MSTSQFGQDLQVLSFYNGKRDGFFVDIGAYDGKYISNTYMLEKNFDWKGICVEPNIRYFNKCNELFNFNWAMYSF